MDYAKRVFIDLEENVVVLFCSTLNQDSNRIYLLWDILKVLINEARVKRINNNQTSELLFNCSWKLEPMFQIIVKHLMLMRPGACLALD